MENPQFEHFSPCNYHKFQNHKDIKVLVHFAISGLLDTEIIFQRLHCSCIVPGANIFLVFNTTLK